ncbi:Glycerol kinase [Rubrobacter radiotolerans]|uniref:ATP:glycerol 3-phosphotransferase n=1 Tax=Rubrobacter radiotolerans TaxID=42256 RepID=A0A023X693_RUBRA|nr:glycerol kinase [Rubrobacter radiotolerans]AHY47741.1 Glycerol kinase [Rubrobacter radiotolerans]MDX5895217.1 glycerol kinase [Rubrobacter radiotolerans]SMC07667.1 glycerol kinase [Rubrobacter radiotolerans DSM 5868]
MSAKYIMALDEGSSSARTLIIDPDGEVVGEARRNLDYLFPRPGWVELDPVKLFEVQLATMHQAMEEAGCTVRDIACVGITTHRETAMIWDRKTGEPVHNAVMWMSKQTDGIIRRWSEQGLDDEIRRRTGLINDSYFSAGKLTWLLENVEGCRARAERGELACGTVDTWLLWNLTGGRAHMTDHSEASRTMIFNLEDLAWDEHLLSNFGIPPELLPEAVPSDSHFGETSREILGESVPITAVLADQQAGLFGQACFEPGMAKNTFGTAGVLTVNTGVEPLYVDGMTTSVAWTAGETSYELEGVVFHSGQTIQYLRDRLHMIEDASETEAIAGELKDTGGVYFVPAFQGLCAPHWNREAKAAIVGITLETETKHIVRAGLESIAYQTKDNIEALIAGGGDIPSLRVDGGAVRNDLLCQFQADILGVPVERPHGLERTGLGVAYLAGISPGLWTDMNDIARNWTPERVFEPRMSEDEREALYRGWRTAVQAACLPLVEDAPRVGTN